MGDHNGTAGTVSLCSKFKKKLSNYKIWRGKERKLKIGRKIRNIQNNRYLTKKYVTCGYVVISSLNVVGK